MPDCPFPCYVEIYDREKKEWVAEVRYYAVEQKAEDHPDNDMRRNFKPLKRTDEN